MSVKAEQQDTTTSSKKPTEQEIKDNLWAVSCITKITQ